MEIFAKKQDDVKGVTYEHGSRISKEKFHVGQWPIFIIILVNSVEPTRISQGRHLNRDCSVSTLSANFSWFFCSDFINVINLVQSLAFILHCLHGPEAGQPITFCQGVQCHWLKWPPSSHNKIIHLHYSPKSHRGTGLFHHPAFLYTSLATNDYSDSAKKSRMQLRTTSFSREIYSRLIIRIFFLMFFFWAMKRRTFFFLLL